MSEGRIVLVDLMGMLREVNVISVSIRLLLAMLIGFAIGLERGTKHRPAGIRTHIFVCMGSAIVMLTAQYATDNLGYGGEITRMGAQVISGVGFLGAGTIMVTGQSHIRGLTTAAGLWFSACIGLAVGIGFYEGVFISCIFVLLILTLAPKVESYFYRKSKISELYIEVDDVSTIRHVIQIIKNSNCEILETNIDKIKYSGVRGASILVSLYFAKSKELEEMIVRIREIKSVSFLDQL